jgi:hypothetical protein
MCCACMTLTFDTLLRARLHIYALASAAIGRARRLVVATSSMALCITHVYSPRPKCARAYGMEWTRSIDVGLHYLLASGSEELQTLLAS